MPTSRSPILDWLRHGLAVIVILSHSFRLLYGSNATEPLMLLTGGQLTMGTLAVFMFFALSGYLITASWRRDPQIARFAKRRLARILPAWGLAMVFGVWVVLPLFSGQWTTNPHILLGAETVASVFPYNPYPGMLNASLWTIPLELLCYCLVALLGYLRLLTKRGIELCLLVIGVVLSIEILWTELWPQLLLIATFWSGALAHFRAHTTWRRSSLALIALTIPLAIATHVFVVVLPIYAYWLLTWLPDCPAPKLRVDWSYGLYVYTYPIQQGIVAALGPQIHPLVLASLSVALGLPICALSWRWIEAPILRRATGRTPHTRGQAIFEFDHSQSRGVR
jgi:peptidoglycan/LPS O-acetylase OafA/YrhL